MIAKSKRLGDVVVVDRYDAPTLCLHFGTNEIADETWRAFADHFLIKSMLADGLLEIIEAPKPLPTPAPAPTQQHHKKRG
jgi:hypothetical protein